MNSRTKILMEYTFVCIYFLILSCILYMLICLPIYTVFYYYGLSEEGVKELFRCVFTVLFVVFVMLDIVCLYWITDYYYKKLR